MTGLGGGGNSFTGMSNQQPGGGTGGGTGGVQPGGWQTAQPGRQGADPGGPGAGESGGGDPGGDPGAPATPGGGQPGGGGQEPGGGNEPMVGPQQPGGGEQPAGGGQQPGAGAGAAAGAAAGGGLRGWLSRVARGAQYGAARGQRATRYLETYGRGYFGRPPERSYSRTAPVDLQSFRNFVDKQPVDQDQQAQARLAQNRESRGQGVSPPIYGRRQPDAPEPNDEWHAGGGGE